MLARAWDRDRGSFVFGFDTDNLEVFERTAEFAIDAQLTTASFAILTPYPATKLYRRLAAEGRLTDPRWWLRANHDADSPYFVPKLMTREQLHEGWQRAWQKFYAPSAIWQRYRPRVNAGWIQILAHLPLNLMQNRLVAHKIIGGQQRFRTGKAAGSASRVRAIVEGLANGIRVAARGWQSARAVNRRHRPA
jgi:radical SAM superfamily enzyme YgiQ (UPF0313 family)